MGAPDVFRDKKVLVAEDEALIALDLEASLRDLGCVVLGPTATVADTLALLADERPDAALLDLDLMDGWSAPVAEALDAAGVPFALVTGHQRDGLDVPVLRDAPCLAKPFGDDDLREAVLGLVGGSPAPARAAAGPPPLAGAES